MESRSGDQLDALAESILRGRPDCREAARSCLSHGCTVEDILTRGVIKAWIDFSDWYGRDPEGALRGWMDSYKATNQVLRELESSLSPPEKPPFSVAVYAVRGEGHVLMRDVLTLLLRSKGLKVYTSKKGAVPEDLEGPLSDPSLKWLVFSCTESALNAQVTRLIELAKRRRPDLKVVAGGSEAGNVGADIVIEGASGLLRVLGLDQTSTKV